MNSRRVCRSIIAGLLLPGCFLCALLAGEPVSTRRDFAELGFSMLVPTNSRAVKVESPNLVGPLPDLSSSQGSVTTNSVSVRFAAVATNLAYAKEDGSSGACVMFFHVMRLTKAEFEDRLTEAHRYHGTLQLELATYRTNSTVIRDASVRRDFTRPDGSILSAEASFRLLDFRWVNPTPDDVGFMKSILDSIEVGAEQKPDP